MPIDYHNYPPNWKEVSTRLRKLAHNRCECCAAEHGRPHPITGSIVILTVHHIGVDRTHPYAPGDPHDKLDCRDENLIVLCQKDHLAADAEIRKLGPHYRSGQWFRVLAPLALARSLTRRRA